MNNYLPVKHNKLILAAALMLSLLAGCNKSTGGLQDVETGHYYTTRQNGQPVFFQLDEINDDSWSGHFYMADNDSTASRHEFSVSRKRRWHIITSEGTQTKVKPGHWSFKPYSEPEFKHQSTNLFREPCSSVSVTEDIVFGQVSGYWDSLPGVEADVMKGFTNGYVKSFKKRDIDLTLDLYRPEDTEDKRPLILFIHGGAFYVGDKQEPAYIDFCNYFASLGYVTASMNYRMGFHVGKGEIERAGYVALQDAHAAMRFLVSHAEEYGIDENELYVAGSSAGSITALNLAFMREKDRPKSSFGAKGFFNGDDLGKIDASGNGIKADFSIRAVANMWGAVSSLDILKNSRTDIISFHGELDEIVPYAEGYPFSSAGKMISQSLSDVMYGSARIDKMAKEEGLRSDFYSFPDKGHAFNTTGKDKTPNDSHLFIKDKIRTFFFQEMVPVNASIRNDGAGQFSIAGKVKDVTWKVEGGFFVSTGDSSAKVIWRSGEKHKLTASGLYPNGSGFVTSYIEE